MSISPFHGGLVFREGKTDSTYPTHIEEVRQAVAQSSNSGPQISSSGSSEASLILGSQDINQFYNPNLSTLSLEEKHKLILSIGEDNTPELPDELRDLLQRKQLFNCYDGFEPSGRMHIA